MFNSTPKKTDFHLISIKNMRSSNTSNKTVKIFLSISGRFFGHFNAKNQC